MVDYVIDTNVLLIASAAHPWSPFEGSDLPSELQSEVFEWLAEFSADSTCKMVWDDWWKIYEEYRHKLSDQDYGLQVVLEKMTTARCVAVDYDNDEAAVVPPGFAAFDRSDRKFLAVLLADGGDSILVNASDTDWLEIELEIAAAGHTVQHLLEDWLRNKYAIKSGNQ